QLLSFSEIDSSHEAYSKLNENQPSLSFSEIRSEFQRQLGSSLEDNFATFNPIGTSASIGQVHKARLHDGRQVAVKLQYPGIRQTISYDLKALGWLMKPLGGLKKGFDVASYKQEIGESLYCEIDYVQEAENLDKFSSYLEASRFGSNFDLQVPNVLDRLSNREIITTSWIEGDSISSILDWDIEERRIVSENLIELFLKSLLEWGLLHADPNPGNYRFFKTDNRPSMGLIDFGCIKEIDTGFRARLISSIFHLEERSLSPSECLEAFQHLGFNADLINPIKASLPQVIETLRAPFLSPSRFDTRQWRLSSSLKESLGEHRMNFRMAGPSDLLFILRSFQGLTQFLNALQAPVDWKPILQRIDKIPTIAAERSQPVADHSVEERPEPASDTLYIRVEENGSLKTSLSFASQATDTLEDLMPNEVRQRIVRQGIDLGRIIRNAQKSNYAPGELFTLNHGPKSVKVWLD
ncbi:MAG: AarF/ABC1/UbiB kinase family protein, partial [Verrucomicrobiota bacterium]